MTVPPNLYKSLGLRSGQLPLELASKAAQAQPDPDSKSRLHEARQRTRELLTPGELALAPIEGAELKETTSPQPFAVVDDLAPKRWLPERHFHQVPNTNPAALRR